MISPNYKLYLISLLFVTCFSATVIKGQTLNNETPIQADSVELNQVLKEVIQNYPSIKEAEEAINAADSKIGLAKSSYYPDIDITAGFTRIGPVSEMTLPGLGTFQLYPENNYSTYVNYRQNIWDFGKTKQNVEFENKSKEITTQSLNLIKQKLAITAVNNYYALLYLQKSILIKQQQINTLNEHLDFVKKKKETGSAIEYEIITTQVKITNVENQKLDLEAARSIQLSVLNNLLGQSATKNHVVKEIPTPKYSEINEDSTVAIAFRNRDEMVMAQAKMALAEIRLKTVKLQNNPVLSFTLSGGFKNGYIPDLTKFQSNYVAGFGFRFPIFDGTRSRYNQSLANSSIITSNFEKDILQRKISNEVLESETNLRVAIKKVKQFELQLEQANKALKLAEISFKAGSITNLDLMDATTSVSESQLYLLKSKIDYMLSIYKFKVSMGERIY